mgnify:CR=1 FL=1
MTELNREALEEIINDVLYDHFREVENWGIEESNGHKRKGACFIRDQILVRAMYIVVQIVLEDILPEIEIRPRWMASRRTS